jgi:hypothetical protein
VTEISLEYILSQFDPEEGEGDIQYIDPQDVKDALTAMWNRIPPYQPYTEFTPVIQAWDLSNNTLESKGDIEWDVAIGKYYVIGNTASPSTARCSGWGFCRLDSPTVLALTDATHWVMSGALPFNMFEIINALPRDPYGEEVEGADAPKITLGYGECVFQSALAPSSLSFHLYPGYAQYKPNFGFPGVWTSPGDGDYVNDAGYELKTRIDTTGVDDAHPLELRYAFDYQVQATTT